MQMLAGAGLCLVEAIVTGEPARFHPEQISFESLLGVVYLIIFGSMVAFTAYAWLLKHAPLSLVGTYAYVNPIVAIGLGTVFLGEALSLRTIVASAIIVTAVAIIVTARSRLGSGSTATTDEATAVRQGSAAPGRPAAPPRPSSG